MTIDSCYEGIIEKLTIQGKILVISKKLLSLANNGDRVLHVYNIIESLNAFPKLLDVKKSEDVSTHYCNLGNQSFQKSRDFEAWQYYNLSLLNAPLRSENYAIALSNRSAVFVSLKLYKECLRDIEEIFKMEYPEKLKEKLTKRQHICITSLSKGSQESDSEDLNLVVEKILNFNGPTDPTYVRASSKLEVKHTEDMGRHVVAKTNIHVGEVLVQDVPYFTLCLKPQLLFSCNYCLSRSGNLYPCDNCCYSLYCSYECKTGAWKSHHATECPLMASLIDLHFTKLELLGLRTVIKARSDHEDWHGLLKTIEEADSNINTEHKGQVYINGQWIYDSKYYASIHTLESNVDKRSVSDIFQKAVSAAVFLHLLKTKTSFLKAESGVNIAKIRHLVSGLLLLHIMTSPTNMHGLSSNVETANGDFVDEISLGSAPFAFLSLLNHSCAPNVVRFSKLGSAISTLFALRPIKKGMQLFDNYGYVIFSKYFHLYYAVSSCKVHGAVLS